MLEKKSGIIFLTLIAFPIMLTAMEKQPMEKPLAQRYINFVLKRDTFKYPIELQKPNGQTEHHPSDIIIIKEMNGYILRSFENSKKKLFVSLDILKQLLSLPYQYRKKELSEHTLKKVATMIQLTYQMIQEAKNKCEKLEVQKNQIRFLYKANTKIPTLLLPETNIEQEIKFFKKLFKAACQGYPCNKCHLEKIQEEFKQWGKTHEMLKYKIGLENSKILKHTQKYEKGICNAIQKILQLIEFEKKLGIESKNQQKINPLINGIK